MFPNALAMWRDSLHRAADQPLIYYTEGVQTLAEVDSASDALALALGSRGIGRGDRVVLYLQNVPQFIVSLLATWKLGGIVVPVNPMLKERELSYVLADSGATGLVCQQELWVSAAAKAVEGSSVGVAVTTSPLDYLPADAPRSRLPSPLRDVQRVDTPGADDLFTLVERYQGRRPEPVSLAQGDVAALTYTSGTTGDPKGAMNTHGNVVFAAQVFRDWLGLAPDDVCLAGAPLFHVTGLIGHAAVAMLVPMPLVLGYRFDPAAMSALAEQHHATYTVMAITAYTAIMNNSAARTRDLSTLSKVYSCGAPIAPSLVERFEQEIGPHIHNIYGLTETTGPSHAVPYGSRAPVDPTSGTLSIGVPVPGVDVRVLDDNGDEVPTGQVGELAISGPGVVPGYWRRPDATKAALRDGEMRTGDAGFVDHRGWFYLVDRKKDMIITAGFKVWPREVEDMLLRHPAVREAAAVGVPDAYRGETVKAFVSLRPGVAPTPDELVAFCRENMAAYKYPRIIEICDDLPKTLTGKLLRRHLRTDNPSL